MTPSMTILGAGIAGLATGVYAQMNGYKTRIYEMHSLPGGLCTAWKRKGFLVDGCIHWLCGSGPGMDLHHYWQELGTAGMEYINHKIYMRLELPEQTFLLYSDANEFEAYVNSIAPEDEEAIHEFCEAIRVMAERRGNMDPVRDAELMDKLNNTSMGAFNARLKNPGLCQAFSTLFFESMPMLFGVFPLAYQHARSGGYPLGGSLEFSKAIEKRYLELGGEVHYNSRAVKILVEDARAVGVQLEDGSVVWEREGDIISTIDVRATFFDLLDGKYLNDGIKPWFEQIPVIVAPVMVTLGIGLPLDDLPTTTNGMLIKPEKPVSLYGQELGLLNVEVFTFEPSAAPQGKAVIRINLPGNYPYWNGLRADLTAYDAEKERVAREVIAALEPRIPGLTAHVEMIDVATPATFERYTGNWQGASLGWAPVPQAYQFIAQAEKEGNWPAVPALPGLSHFYTAGQWHSPFGGLPTAAMTARALIELICKRDGKEFTVTR